MGENSKIEWTDHTFNPWRGCVKISPGCAHCYAEAGSKRNPEVLGVWGPDGTRPIAAEAYWRTAFRWHREAKEAGVRRRVFCASLADVFEDREDLDRPRARLLGLIRNTPSLDWLLLTKRPDKVRHLLGRAWNVSPSTPGAMIGDMVADWLDGNPPANVWLGTSVEDRKHGLPRIDVLGTIPAAVRFLSIEPLLEDLGPLDLAVIDWVIVGGESGPDARPMNPLWVRRIRDRCVTSGVAFHFKQWGEFAPFAPDPGPPVPGRRVSVPSGIPMDEPTSMFRVGKKHAGRLLDGRTWDDLPKG